MNCPYLDSFGHCKASPVWNGSYDPNEEEKKKYCNNELDMRDCRRLQLFQRHMDANSNSPSVSNINTNNNVNSLTNTNSSNLSIDLKEALEIAYATVEVKKDITQDEKDQINGRLRVLERELGKESTKIDVSKVERLRASFEKYSWLIPIIIDITKKALGT